METVLAWLLMAQLTCVYVIASGDSASMAPDGPTNLCVCIWKIASGDSASMARVPTNLCVCDS